MTDIEALLNWVAKFLKDLITLWDEAIKKLQGLADMFPEDDKKKD